MWRLRFRTNKKARVSGRDSMPCRIIGTTNEIVEENIVEKSNVVFPN